MQLAQLGPNYQGRVRQFSANRQSRDGRNKEMRSILSLLVVCLFATTTVAQFGGKNGASARPATLPADAGQKKATNEKGHPGKAAAAADQAGADADLADALLIAMDTDHDGIVTKIEMNKAMAALRKVHKDNKGNMTVPDKAATDPNAAAGADAGLGQDQAGAGAAAGVDQRNDNEAMARFMQYDTNHDGVLSPNEVPPQARAMLRDADLNRDGVIDAKELQAFSRKMGERMKAFSAGANPNGAGGTQGNGRVTK
jgi:Ca2+-binding EF-hand superfamily protein